MNRDADPVASPMADPRTRAAAHIAGVSHYYRVDPKGDLGPYVLGEHHWRGIQCESEIANRLRRLA